MKTIINPKKEDWSILLQRSTQSVEDIEDAVYSEHIDYAYDYLYDVTEEHITKLQKQLQETFNNWAKEYNYEPNFFTVNEYYEFTRTQKEEEDD